MFAFPQPSTSKFPSLEQIDAKRSSKGKAPATKATVAKKIEKINRDHETTIKLKQSDVKLDQQTYDFVNKKYQNNYQNARGSPPSKKYAKVSAQRDNVVDSRATAKRFLKYSQRDFHNRIAEHQEILSAASSTLSKAPNK